MSKKISALEAAVDVETSDIVAIVDLSEGETKKATIAQLLAMAGGSIPFNVGDTPRPSDGVIANVGTLLGSPLFDLANLVGDGDNTNAANYQTLFRALEGTDYWPVLAVYAYASGAKDILLGGRWDWSTGDPRPDAILAIANSFQFKVNDARWYIESTGDMLRMPLLGKVSTTNATPTAITNIPFGTFITAGTCLVVGRTSGSKVCAFEFRFAWDGSTIINAADLSPIYERKAAAAAACDCVIDASGSVIVTGLGATNMEWRSFIIAVRA